MWVLSARPPVQSAMLEALGRYRATHLHCLNGEVLYLRKEPLSARFLSVVVFAAEEALASLHAVLYRRYMARWGGIEADR